MVDLGAWCRSRRHLAADVEARRWQHTTIDTWAPGVRDRLIVVLPPSITGRVIPTNVDGDWFAGVPGS
jgi:hypothetical protein